MNIAVIFAGGVGSRMRSKDLPKQFLKVFDKPIVIRTLEHFENNHCIDAIVIACIKEYIDYMGELIDRYSISKVKKIVPGGETGQLSIYSGLLAAKNISSDKHNIVLIHDGVRPLINDDLITANIEMVSRRGNCITAGIVKETIVEIGEDGIVKHVPSRKNSRVAKAPQSFRLEEILSIHEDALAKGINNSIDSCTLYSMFRKTLYMLDGPYENIKITTPDDFFTMRAILETRENEQIYLT